MTLSLIDHLEVLFAAEGGARRVRGAILSDAVNGRLSESSSDWTVRSLKSLVDKLNPGFACSKKHQQEGGVVHLRTHNVGPSGDFNTDLLVTIDPSKADPKKVGIQKDDVIFNNTNSRELVGKSCVVPQDLEYGYSNHMTLLRPGEDITGTFLWCCLQAYWRSGHFERTCKAWIGQAGVDTKSVGALELRVPPIAEQHRIVAKVDELMEHAAVLEERHLAATSARVRMRDAALHALAEAEDAAAVKTAWLRLETHFDDLFTEPEDVTPLRETILQLAVRGRLVEQAQEDGSAEDLATRIRAEATVAVKSRAKIILEGQPPFDPPAGWTFVRLGEAMNLVNGRAFKKSEWSSNGLPIIRIQNLNDASADFNHCAIEVPEKFHVHSGDLLFSWSGTPGTSFGAFRWRRGHGLLNQHIFKCEPRARAWNLDFLREAINSRLDHLISAAHGAVGIQHVTRGRLDGLWIPLPPLAEQERIVAKVDELMALCDTLEASLTRAKEARERFAESISHALDQPAERDDAVADALTGVGAQ